MSRTSVWIVDAGNGDCDHPGEQLRHVGDDGINAYFQCTCAAVLVSRIDELVAVVPARDTGSPSGSEGAYSRR